MYDLKKKNWHKTKPISSNEAQHQHYTDTKHYTNMKPQQ